MAEENAIRQQRRRTNKLIAEHQAERLRPFFDPEIKLIRGDGTMVVGADALIGAFELQYKDPTFITYLRTTETVTVDKAGTRAAERGTWVGSWHGPTGEMGHAGQYLAVWKKTPSQWVLESELYVTLS